MSIIRAYGLFWRQDEINWYPGGGKKSDFCLLGRRGATKGTLRLVDFRRQHGIYILYGNLGPHYVGLCLEQDLGKRLKDHLTDGHKNKWDRFSWFGFRRTLGGKDENGLRKLAEMAAAKWVEPGVIIRDSEALLIRAMALRNKAQMKFSGAEEWTQVKLDEVARYRAMALKQ